MRFIQVFFFQLLYSCLVAQTTSSDTLRSVEVAPVTVSAARFESKDNRLPYAVSIANQYQIQKGQAQRSLQESLVMLPGVFSMNADNFSQDLRISIRGFGARSAFGIRGVRLLVDGIPESTPDGTADVDNVDAGALQRIELLRGAAAGLYGNASGGVLNLTTEDPTVQPFGEVQTVVGSFGFRRIQAKSGFSVGKLGTFISLSHNQAEGYRPQSDMQQTTLNLKMRYLLTEKTKIQLLVNYGNSLYAHDPGGLTLAQTTTNRQQARAANVQFDAGETVAQGRAGLVLEQRFSEKHTLKLTAFATTRSFSNRLAFNNGGWVAFGRVYGGGSAIWHFKTQKYRAQIGTDINNQRDQRQRFNNIDGKKGAQTFDQTERYNSTGIFGIQEYMPFKKWIVSASTRLDILRLRANDHFQSDGDQSGTRAYNRFNPMMGVVFLPTSAISVYGNIASNFETPTLNELSANPSNLGGFNPDLKPQESVNVELGTKIRFNDKVSIDLAFFQIDLRNELVAYQLATAPGRTFFRNAGKSRRQGIETALNLSFTKGLALTLHYTYADFRYRQYELQGVRLDGHRQLAQPRSVVYGALQWAHTSGFYVIAQVQYQSSMYVHDLQQVKTDGYTLGSMRGGITLKRKKWQIEPFAGANNIFHAAYFNNILINAVGDRFFEPAPDFATFYSGIKVRL